MDSTTRRLRERSACYEALAQTASSEKEKRRYLHVADGWAHWADSIDWLDGRVPPVSVPQGRGNHDARGVNLR
jgi:hypothetical protein